MTTTEWVIYSIPNCKYCELAKQLLRQEGEIVTDIAVDLKPDLAVKLIEETGQKTWPKIYYNGEFIGGYTDLKGRFR